MFLAALGAWFRAFAAKTHRSAPLMDGFDFHPYPVPQSQPFAQGYQNPNEATVSNLPRIYQAFYNAFAGTSQRTIGQQVGGGLPVSLNETGVQTASTGHGDYVGSEVSATGAGGVVGQYATEAFQSQWYSQMLGYVACDPNVQVVDIFHLVDEQNLAGWQSGLYYYASSTPTAKLAAQTVKSFLAGGARCAGSVKPWTPARVVPAPTTAPTGTAPKPVVATPSAWRKRQKPCAAYIKAQRRKLARLQAKLAHTKARTQRQKLQAQIAAVASLVGAASTALPGLGR